MNRTNNSNNYAIDSFSDFVQSFGTWQPEQEIILDSDTGAGNIKCINVEAGLQLCIWDCKFRDEIRIFSSEKTDEAEQEFSVFFYLTPGSFVPAISSFGGRSVFDTVLISNKAEFKAYLLPGKELHCVSLTFSPDWIQANILSDITAENNLFNRFCKATPPLTIFESLSALERKLVDSLFEVHKQPLHSKFFIRSKALNLLTAFFSKIANRLLPGNLTNKYHGQQIAEVEKQLTENIYNGLPDIKTLAKKVAISESTLKRYFRIIYGKNIYSYFLEKRMACAKILLIDKRKTVSETASIMGYENVSHFSNTFKKFYGTLPGTLKNGQLQIADS